MRAGTVGFAVVLVVSSLMPATVAALGLYDEEGLTLGANLHAGTVAGVELRTDEPDDYGFELSLARAQLHAAFEDRGRVKVQVSGSSGDVELLDAFATLELAEWIEVRMGRDKLPVSAENLFSSPDLPFIGRALLNDFVPGRATGIETVGMFEAGGVELEGRIGLHQPPRTSLTSPGGQLFSARTLVTLPLGVYVHAGYAQHVIGENELPSVTDDRVFEFDHPIDAAVGYEKAGWDLHLEGLTVLDPPEVGTIYGTYAHAQYRFGDEEGLEFEPGVAYDFVYAGEGVHRASAGLNTFWWGTGFETLLNYRYTRTPPSETDIHAMLLSLRGKL